MKLHIGCGKDYQQGFINIDAYDTTVADHIMPADNLTYQSNTIDEIHAKQLIEHLGLSKTMYALAEWFRVLKPTGRLLIETPHLEKSITSFIRGDSETRKNVITWIFGVDNPGMMHHFCFPEELLIMILKKTGFITIQKNYFEIEPHHHALQIRCRKPRSSTTYQIIAEVRKQLIHNNDFTTNDYYISLEQEKLIDFFAQKTIQLLKNHNNRILDELTIEGCLRHPHITRLLFQQLQNKKIISKTILKKHMNIIDNLETINYPRILYHLIQQVPDTADMNFKAFNIITHLGKQTIQKMLSSRQENKKIHTQLKNLKERYDTKQPFYFSEDILQRDADIYFRTAIKTFFQKKYTPATRNMQKATKLVRNNLFYYWNLARLHRLQHHPKAAIKNYDNALYLIQQSTSFEKEKLVSTITKEKNHFNVAQHGKPIQKITF